MALQALKEKSFNITKNGHIVLNRDDKFFNFHEKLAKKEN